MHFKENIFVSLSIIDEFGAGQSVVLIGEKENITSNQHSEQICSKNDCCLPIFVDNLTNPDNAGMSSVNQIQFKCSPVRCFKKWFQQKDFD